MCQDERIKEACGVFGIYNPHGEDAASLPCSTVDRNPAESLCLTPAVPREI